MNIGRCNPQRVKRALLCEKWNSYFNDPANRRTSHRRLFCCLWPNSLFPGWDSIKLRLVNDFLDWPHIWMFKTKPVTAKKSLPFGQRTRFDEKDGAMTTISFFDRTPRHGHQGSNRAIGCAHWLLPRYRTYIMMFVACIRTWFWFHSFKNVSCQ